MKNNLIAYVTLKPAVGGTSRRT